MPSRRAAVAHDAGASRLVDARGDGLLLLTTFRTGVVRLLDVPFTEALHVIDSQPDSPAETARGGA